MTDLSGAADSADLEALNAQRLAALGADVRLRLFRLLVRAGEGGMPVGAIQETLDVPASTLSHHIAALRQAGLVAQQKEGRSVLTVANFEAMHGLVDYLTEECCCGYGENAHG